MGPIGGSSAHNSGGGNRGNGMTSIELREYSTLLSSRDRYYDGNG